VYNGGREPKESEKKKKKGVSGCERSLLKIFALKKQMSKDRN
jgi:hypothetical protein